MARRSCTSQRCSRTFVALVLCTGIAHAEGATDTTLPPVNDPLLAANVEIAVSDGDLIDTGASEAEIEAARAAFWKAHRHFEAGEYEAALALFGESYRLFPQPELVFNIALTHERLGNCAAALETYDRYLIGTGPRAANDRERAADNRAELAMRCELPAAPPPAIEPALATAPLPAVTRAEPTPGTIVLSDSSRVAASDSRLQTRLAWAALGTAVASLGAVAYFDVRRRTAHADYSEAKNDYEDNRTPAAADAMNRAEADFYRARTLEIAMGVVSSALAATGSALLIYDASPDSDGAARAKSRAPALTIGWVGAF